MTRNSYSLQSERTDSLTSDMGGRHAMAQASSSSSSDTRSLAERKQELLIAQRRLYIASERGRDLREVDELTLD